MPNDDEKSGAHTRRVIGSLRQALAAASHADANGTGDGVDREGGRTEPPTVVADPLAVSNGDVIASPDRAEGDTPGAASDGAGSSANGTPPPLPDERVSDRRSAELPSAEEAAREARGGRPNIPPVDRHIEFEPATITTIAPSVEEADPEDRAFDKEEDSMAPTQLVRGKQKVERGAFQQDPVVGWLVIVGGPGIGSFRPIFEGNNTIGRSTNNRVPIDFGDDAISSDEQAYIRYDSTDRTFLFVPNLAKTNVVSLNDQRPAAAVPLQAMDVIVMGKTQLVFVPFCGSDFDWSELSEQKA